MALKYQQCAGQVGCGIEVGGVVTPAGLTKRPHTVVIKQKNPWRLAEGWGLMRSAVNLRSSVASPALRDEHVHLYDTAGLSPFLEYGVCALRDLGSPLAVAVELANLRASCGRPMPRVKLGGPVFDRPGSKRLPSACEWTSEREVWRMLEYLRDRGAHWAKLYGGFPAGLVAAFVAKAHSIGLRVAAHARPGTIRTVLDAGVDEIEHLSSLIWLVREPEGDQFGAHATYRAWGQQPLTPRELTHIARAVATVRVCPTLAVHHQLVSRAGKAWDSPEWPANLLAEWRRFPVVSHSWEPGEISLAEQACTEMRKCFKYLLGRRARLVLGSDTPNPGLLPGQGLWHEINQFSAAGMPPMKSLLSASVNPCGISPTGYFDLTFIAAKYAVSAEQSGIWPVAPVAGILQDCCLHVHDAPPEV